MEGNTGKPSGSSKKRSQSRQTTSPFRPPQQQQTFQSYPPPPQQQHFNPYPQHQSFHPFSPHQNFQPYQQHFSPNDYQPQFSPTAFGTYRDQPSDDDDDVDAIPETQESSEDDDEQPTQPIQPTQTKKSAMKPQAWTPQQEKALAMAWIDISEDSEVGNGQKLGGFWKRILQNYNERVHGSTRTFHQLNSKWKDLSRHCGKFNGLYGNNMMSRRSGESDLDVFNNTQDQYRIENKGKQFNHIDAWKILREHPKWLSQQSVEDLVQPLRKKSRTTESNTVGTPSSDAAFGGLQVDEEIEEEDVEPIRRSRNKGKKPASSSSQADPEVLERLSTFQTEQHDDFEDKKQYRREVLQIKREKMEAYKKALDAQQQQRDMEFIISPHDHLQGKALELVLQRKQQIANRWGWEI